MCVWRARHLWISRSFVQILGTSSTSSRMPLALILASVVHVSFALAFCSVDQAFRQTGNEAFRQFYSKNIAHSLANMCYKVGPRLQESRLLARSGREFTQPRAHLCKYFAKIVILYVESSGLFAVSIRRRKVSNVTINYIYS